ncbi:MAG: hypothetical protein HY699_18630 [Deltaproteobacteria bacterium]|nr:hypothetical protein [Deltaproteobacteria bacterium]
MSCPERFGMWRLWDLSAFPTIAAVTSRFVNESPEGLARLAGTDDPLMPPSPYDLIRLAAFVPNELGIPEDVASLGTQVAYVANAPFIGVQAILPNEMDVRELKDKQVHGTFHGSEVSGNSQPIRSVSTLTDPADGGKHLVLAVQERGAEGDRLVLLNPNLSQADEYGLEQTVRAVKGLKNWPARLDPSTQDVVPRDLAVVSISEGLRVLAVNVPDNNPPGGAPPAPASLDKTGAQLKPGLNESTAQNWIGRIAMPGHSPGAVAYDPSTQLLFVADGTNGLTIIDLSVPGGSSVTASDGVDDRVLGTVNLGGARARSVAVWRDGVGLVAGVATGKAGVYIVPVQPPEASSLVAEVSPPSAAAAVWTGGEESGFACCGNCTDTNSCTDDACLPDGTCEHVQVTNPTQGCCKGVKYDLTTTCCVDGKLRQKQVSDFDALSTGCPNRVQNQLAHVIDGCSNVPDDPVDGQCSVAPTRFGSTEGTLPQGSQALSLPCNQHDMCYQTCRANRAACDSGIFESMLHVCSLAYPTATCPFVGPDSAKCPCYAIERQLCVDTASLYYQGLQQLGESAWKSRQVQYCACCE